MFLFFISIVIGAISGVFSSMIGGASGQIIVPLLLVMGVPPYTALSTPKMGAVGIAIGSLYKYYGTRYIKWSFVLLLTILAAGAGVLGATFLLKTPENVLDKIVAGLLLVSVLFMYHNKEIGLVSVITSKVRRGVGYIFYFLSEMLRAAFGSGFGMITGIVLMYFFGMTMIESNATKRIPGVVVSVVALVTFWSKGVIDIPIGVGLLVGGIIGSYVGTHYAIKMGDILIKRLFVVFSLVMAVILLF